MAMDNYSDNQGGNILPARYSVRGIPRRRFGMFFRISVLFSTFYRITRKLNKAETNVLPQRERVGEGLYLNKLRLSIEQLKIDLSKNVFIYNTAESWYCIIVVHAYTTAP